MQIEQFRWRHDGRGPNSTQHRRHRGPHVGGFERLVMDRVQGRTGSAEPDIIDIRGREAGVETCGLHHPTRSHVLQPCAYHVLLVLDRFIDCRLKMR